MPKTYRQLNPNERDIVAVLKSKGDSLREIARVLKRSPSTLSRELKRNAPPVYTGYYLAHKAQERANKRKHESHGRQRLKSDSIGGMSKNAFASDGLRNLSPEGSLSNALGNPLAMKPSINGFTKRPPISFCPWCEPIASANTEATPENIKNRIFQRGSRSKSVRKPFLSAFTSAIGKLTPSAAVKATRLSRLPWNVKPDTQRWRNLKPKAHEP